MEIQLKGANEFAEKYRLTVREYFGGTYESAASDERRESQNIAILVPESKNNIHPTSLRPFRAKSRKCVAPCLI